jgi:hypothetical protein
MPALTLGEPPHDVISTSRVLASHVRIRSISAGAKSIASCFVVHRDPWASLPRHLIAWHHAEGEGGSKTREGRTRLADQKLQQRRHAKMDTSSR